MAPALDAGLRLLPDLAPFLADPAVSEIMVNQGGRAVFIEREGQLFQQPIVIQERLLLAAIKRLGRAQGKEVSDDESVLTTRLADGSRVAAVLPPQSIDGATLTIRRFGRRFTLAELLDAGTLTQAQCERLLQAINRHETILISGSTGSGKTTLLNALAMYISDHERIITIEDTSEIYLRQPNVVRFESRPAERFADVDRPRQAVTIRDLLKEALRHRPDRLILGEVRLEEASDLLQALNTGHRGSFSTIHANSAPQALTRLRHLVLAHDPGGTLDDTVREAIADAIQLVVHLDRVGPTRRVTELYTVTDADRFRSQSRGSVGG